MSDILLPKNPTPDERAKAAEHGWYFYEPTRAWSRYEDGVITVLDLRKFEEAFNTTEALDSDEGKAASLSSSNRSPAGVPYIINNDDVL